MTKKILRIVMSLMSVYLMFGSVCCSAQDGFEDIKLNKAQEYALKEPGKRAYGEGVSFYRQEALDMAVQAARGAFSDAISTAVRNATKKRGNSLESFSGDFENGKLKRESSTDWNSNLKAISQQVVESTAIVMKVPQYNKNSRVYRMCVCLEYKGDIAKLAKEITEKIIEDISDEDRLKMEYNFDKFENEIEEELGRGNQDEIYYDEELS